MAEQASSELRIERCRNVALARRVLSRDYFDAPVRHFSTGLKNALATAWTADPPDIWLIVASVGDEYAGFVLAHGRGRDFWRSVTREHPLYLPVFAWAWLQTRLFTYGVQARLRSSPASAGKTTEARLTGVEELNRPFAWASEPGVGTVELLYVSPEFRGRGVAPALIMGAEAAMAQARLHRAEAHVDPANIASVRAFQRAGWKVYRMSLRDFWTIKDFGARDV